MIRSEVVQHLRDRYGEEPDFSVWDEVEPPHPFYTVRLQIVDITFEPMVDVDGWNWTVEGASKAYECQKGYSKLPDACDAAENLAFGVLSEAREFFEKRITNDSPVR